MNKNELLKYTKTNNAYEKSNLKLYQAHMNRVKGTINSVGDDIIQLDNTSDMEYLTPDLITDILKQNLNKFLNNILASTEIINSIPMEGRGDLYTNWFYAEQQLNILKNMKRKTTKNEIINILGSAILKYRELTKSGNQQLPARAETESEQAATDDFNMEDIYPSKNIFPKRDGSSPEDEEEEEEFNMQQELTPLGTRFQPISVKTEPVIRQPALAPPQSIERIPRAPQTPRSQNIEKDINDASTYIIDNNFEVPARQMLQFLRELDIPILTGQHNSRLELPYDATKLKKLVKQLVVDKKYQKIFELANVMLIYVNAKSEVSHQGRGLSKFGSSSSSSGNGLLYTPSHTSTGRGVPALKPTERSINAKYFIDIQKLKNNILELRYHCNRHLTNIKSTHVSNDLKKIIEDMLLRKSFSHKEFLKLESTEKSLVRQIMPLFDIYQELDDDTNLQDELEVLIGSIKAGNDSTIIKKKLKQLLLHSVNTSRMSRHNCYQLISELGL